MNIKDLDNFQYVSQFKSFSFAAKIIGVSQPTLSESIKRLETDIGQQLFYRSKKGIELTPSGTKVLTLAKRILNTKGEILALGDLSKSNHQSFKLGCHSIVAGYFFGSYLEKLDKFSPEISIHLEHGHSRSIQTQIQNGIIDFGVVVNAIKNPDLIIKKICEDKIYIWKAKNIKSIKNQFLGDTQLPQVQSIIRKWKTAPIKNITSSDFFLTGKLAEQGMGYALLPERFVAQQQLKLTKVLKNNHYKDEFSLVYRPEFGKNETERFLISTIAKSFE